MGYRSQVACVISVDTMKVVVGQDNDGQTKYAYTYDKDKFKQMIGFIKLSRFWELWQNSSDQDAIGWRNGKFIMYGADWKWYPDYADVRAFHEMFNQLGQIEGISGYYLRVGEEMRDVEEEEFGDDPCYDYFHAFSAMDFQGEDYLGKRETDDEEPQAQDAIATQS